MAPGSRLQDLTAKYMQNPRRYFVPLANEYRQAGELDRAIALCREHLPAQPGHMSGHIVLGCAYFEKGDVDAAREVFLTSVALDDENIIALRHLGDIARLQDETAEARQWYARVLDADPQNAEVERLLRSLSDSPRIAPAQGQAYVAAVPRVGMPTPYSGASLIAATPVSVPPVLPAEVPPLAPSAPAEPAPRAVPSFPSWLDSLEAPAPARPADHAGFDLSDAALALSEPTPPGLRAIIGADDDEDESQRPSAASTHKPLEILDRTTLELTPRPAIEPESDGAGFVFAELDELTETFSTSSFASAETLPPPSAADFLSDTLRPPAALDFPGEALPPLAAEFPADTLPSLAAADSSVETLPLPAADFPAETLPPPAAADLSAGVMTPEVLSAIAGSPPTPAEDLFSRPAFGALASFAAWRTSQERETPSATQPTLEQPTVDEPVLESTPAQPVIKEEPAEIEDDSVELGGEAPPPSLEFETETMAQLYVQQGYVEEGLAVYRALAARSPGDDAIAAEIRRIESQLLRESPRNSLQIDADNALQFNELELAQDLQGESSSVLEDMYLASPLPTFDAPPVTQSFGTGWRPETDAELASDEDWFAEETAAAEREEERPSPEDEMFGVALDGFSSPPDLGPAGTASGSPVSTAGLSSALADVFGASAARIAVADDSAGEFLVALAGQMVGRLPKEAPTLPVPDVLDLPSGVGDDESAGAPAAPLLSFDRFFSGSGSAPRTRVDTPPRTPPLVPSVAPAPASLSPTFGGVPVIPPPPAAATVPWASFEHPASGQLRADEPAADAGGRRLPQWMTADESPAPQMPETVPPVHTVPTLASPLHVSDAPPAADLRERSEPPGAPAPADSSSGPDGGEAAASQAPRSEPPRPAPSEFHRWLEGLS